MKPRGDANKEKGPGWSFDGLNVLRTGTNCSVASRAIVVRHDRIADAPAERHLFAAGHTFHA